MAYLASITKGLDTANEVSNLIVKNIILYWHVVKRICLYFHRKVDERLIMRHN